MPLYSYTCDSCGEFQEWQSIAASGAPLACPICKVPASRALASPHVRTSAAAIRYVAEGRNEKSAHEPMIEHRLKSLPHHHHGPKHGKSGHDAHAHPPVKRSHRPWMIGH
jgi:putative FmdB family regulatory protein